MWKAFMYDLPLPERKTDINEYRWILESELLTVKGEELLVVNCYFKNNKELNYRVFISKSQYITLDCTTQKPSWKTGKIDNYAKTEWWRSDVKGVYIEKEYSDIIINYIGGSAKDGYDAVCKFQSNMLAQRILRAEKRITDPIDVKMEQVGNLPEDFKQWLIEDVFIESRYIYYQYEKKVNLKGYCTYCEREAMVYKPIHNQVGTCPCCGSSIIYKSIGKSKHIEDIRFVSIMQKTDDGFLIRHFKIKKKYYGSEWRYKKPETNVWEEERTFYDNDINTDNYDFSMFKNKYTRWNKRDSGMVSHESHVYPHNVYECIRDSKIRFCELQTLAGNKVDFEFCVERFIRKYKEGNVYLEHLIKAGLFSLVKDLVEYYGEKDEINHKGKTLNAVLGIENDDIRILREANITYDVLQLFKIQRKLGRRLTVEQLKKIDVNYNSEKVNQIFSYAPVTKALKYLGTQPKYVSDPETLYLDYLDSCKKLGQDLKNSFVLFPKDLRAAHDVNVEIINEKANRKTARMHNSKYAAIRKLNKELNELYFYEDDNFLIRPPVDAAEIVKEGQSLHHCVGGGGYSEQMSDGKIAILFLRDKQAPDTPYYTIEINRKENRILQCHGYKNKDKDKKRIEPFIRKFKKNVLEKKKEERKAG